MKTAIDQDEITLEIIEKRVWQDISRARANHAVLQQFLRPLARGSSSYYRNRDVPLTGAIAHAAVDSIVSALGRLLQPNPSDRESTISKYRNRIISLLRERGRLSEASSYSQQRFDLLSDRQYLNTLKKQQKEFTEEILPLRDKLVAHSEIDFEGSLFAKAAKYIGPCIEFIEEVHRTCRSALDDAANPDPYLNGRFGSVAQDWINALQTRKQPGRQLNDC